MGMRLLWWSFYHSMLSLGKMILSHNCLSAAKCMPYVSSSIESGDNTDEDAKDLSFILISQDESYLKSSFLTTLC